MTAKTEQHQGREGELREELAAYAHAAWSGWMQYMFGKCESRCDGFLIPMPLVDRWTRQKDTPYANLPDVEKESDRKEADRMMAIMQANAPAEQGENMNIEDILNTYRTALQRIASGISSCIDGTISLDREDMQAIARTAIDKVAGLEFDEDQKQSNAETQRPMKPQKGRGE